MVIMNFLKIAYCDVTDWVFKLYIHC